MADTASRRRAPGMTTEQRREMILQTALPLVAEYGRAVTTAQIARAAGIGEATVFRVFADKDELLQACIARTLDPAHLLSELGSIDLALPLADRLVEAAEALGAYLGRMGAVMGALHASGHPLRRRSPLEATGEPSGHSAMDRSAPDQTSSRSSRDATLGRSAGDEAPDRSGRADTPQHSGRVDTPQRSGRADTPQHSGRADTPQRSGRDEAPDRTQRLLGREESQRATAEAVGDLFRPDADRLRLPVDVSTKLFLSFISGRGRAPGDSADVTPAELVDLFLHGALKPA